jgi:hypothetical protein
MWFLSRDCTHRQLVLLVARLILQCVMVGSISRTGMDEFEAMCLRAPDTTSGQSMVCGERDQVALGSSDWLSKVR